MWEKVLPNSPHHEAEILRDTGWHRCNNTKKHHKVSVNICPECGDKVKQDGKSRRWRRFCSYGSFVSMGVNILDFLSTVIANPAMNPAMISTSWFGSLKIFNIGQ